MLELIAPSLAAFEKARQWRNNNLESLRTPFLLTKEMQEEFYQDVICSRQSNVRFWAVEENNADVIGLVGLVNIAWENRSAEISIILSPTERRKGHGEEAFRLLLRKGFDELNLENIYGECYLCNPSIMFWEKLIAGYDTKAVRLTNRKFWDGKYWDSIYFNFEAGLVRAVGDDLTDELRRGNHRTPSSPIKPNTEYPTDPNLISSVEKKGSPRR